MSAIIDLVDFAEILNLKLKGFKSKYKIDPGQPTEKEALELIFILVDVKINNQLKWAKKDDIGIYAIVEKTFPWWKPSAQDDVSMDFYDEVICEVCIDLYQVLDRVSSKPTWDIITVKRKGTSCFIIRGEDFRIVDWYRMQKEKAEEEKTSEDFLAGIH